MEALIIGDKEFEDNIFCNLKDMITDALIRKGFSIKFIEIDNKEITFCRGCFGCWIKTPGECIMKDKIVEINKAFVNSSVTFYLSPVMFGQFSANMKNVIDRSLPNVLPYFVKGPDGSTTHPMRYENNPAIYIIGYGENIEPFDQKLFSDITKRHRSSVEVLLYGGITDNEKILGEVNLL